MKPQALVNDIGRKQGRMLIFGGVYSNFQALEALMKIAEKLDVTPENIICTGDIVGYCADPEKVVQTIKEWGIHGIAGNVELQLAEGLEDCGCDFSEGGRCDVFSKQWYPFAQAAISEDSLNWIKKLPEFIQFQYGKYQVFVVHGSYFATADFIFKSTEWAKKADNFTATQSDVILAGHCGLPFSDYFDSKYWLNPGVIGMPANDATTRVWYMILDVTNEILNYTHHSYQYDFKAAAQAMKVQQLPISYAETLCSGLWDNCEILPEVETAQQGIPLLFK